MTTEKTHASLQRGIATTGARPVALLSPPCGAQLQGMQATRDAAPGLLASGTHYLGAHHAPDLGQGQPALRQAVSAPMAATHRAAAKALAQVEETLHRGHEPLDHTADEPPKRGPGCPPQAAVRLEQGAQDVEAARHEPQRLAGQRAQVTQRRRASGHAYHFVALERGVRRTGTLIASDIQEHRATLRTLAQQAQLSATCLDRRANAARVGPTMPAPIACVSGAGRQQVRQRDLAPLVSYAMHASRIPSYSLDRAASTRTVPQGEPLRVLAAPLRPPWLQPVVPGAR